jgi:hypothetical protein
MNAMESIPDPIVGGAICFERRAWHSRGEVGRDQIDFNAHLSRDRSLIGAQDDAGENLRLAGIERPVLSIPRSRAAIASGPGRST